jgi:hypothetical protein
MEQPSARRSSNLIAVNQINDRRYLGLTLLLAGVLGGAAAVLLLQCRQRTASAGARKADHDDRCRDMVAEGGPHMDDAEAT